MTIITKIPGITFTDTTLPKLYRDAVINNGTLFMFDFLDTYCNPSAVGPLANGTVFKNLVDGAPNATAFLNYGGVLQNTGTGLSHSANGYSSVGLGSTYDLSGTNSPFLATIWFKTDPAQNAALPGVMGLAGNTSSTNQYAISTGASPGVSTTQFNSSGSGSSLTTGVAPTTLQQIGVYWSPGVTQLFRNGALVTSGGATSTLVAGTTGEAIGNNGTALGAYGVFFGKSYRAWKENLALSSAASGLSTAAQALAQIQKDYAANVGRFS